MHYSFNYNYSSKSNATKLAFKIMLRSIENNIDVKNCTVNTFGILNFINGFNILKVEGGAANLDFDEYTLNLISSNLKIKFDLILFLKNIRNLCAHIYEKENNIKIFETEDLTKSKYFYKEFHVLLFESKRNWRR